VTIEQKAKVALLFMVSMALVMYFRYRSFGVPPLPAELDTSAMEPEVGAKLQAARKAIVDNPRSAEAWTHFGMVLHAHKLDAAAAEVYAVSLGLKPDARVYYYRAKVLEAEKPDVALILATEAVAYEPSYVPARIEKSYLLEQTGRLDDAIAELATVAAGNNENAVEFARGRLLLAKGDADGALAHLQRALAAQPNLGSAHALAARALRMKGDTDAAAREAAAARGLPIGTPVQDPWIDDVDAEAVSVLGYVNRARRAERTGDAATAESLYRHVVEIRPQDADVRFVLGEMYLRQQRFPDALAAYQGALGVQPTHAMAHLRVGQLEEGRGNLAEALAHYRQAVQASPELAILHRALAAALEKSGDARGAKAEAAEADRLAPAPAR
jgi:tetratricopeptide (TPR) repeat protein